MANAVTFDTLKFVETLKASGFDDIQAKGMATAIREVQAAQSDELTGQLSTKADVAKVEMHILELKRDIKELELRMVIQTGGMILAGIGILIGIVRVWPLPVQYVPSPGQETRYAVPAPRPPTMVAPLTIAPENPGLSPPILPGK